MADDTYPFSVDVIGVDVGDSGRSCTTHMACGHYVQVSNILIAKWCVQDFGNGLEQCYQVWKIGQDGLPTCHVGYLPKRLFSKKPDKYFDGIVLRVAEDLRVSENSAERQRSHRNHGLVYCIVENNNPCYAAGIRVFEGEAFDMSSANSLEHLENDFDDGAAGSDSDMETEASPKNDN